MATPVLHERRWGHVVEVWTDEEPKAYIVGWGAYQELRQTRDPFTRWKLVKKSAIATRSKREGK